MGILTIVFTLAFGVAGMGLSLVPEWILYRQRLLFSIFDLGDDAVLLPFEHVTHDGLQLRSWYIAPADEKPVIVYFAGRDGDLMRKPGHLFELAQQEGYGVLLVGYRGFGGNPGSPREFDLHLDATYLLAQFQKTGIPDDGYILYGYSMGSAIAANAATHIDTQAVILEAPISSFLQAVRQQARGVPAWLIRTRFDNVARMAEINAPTLLLAGGRDPVTPALFAHSLAEANPAMARVKVIEDANHINIIRLGGRQAVRDFLDGFMSREPVPADMPQASPPAPVRASAALASAPAGAR